MEFITLRRKILWDAEEQVEETSPPIQTLPVPQEPAVVPVQSQPVVVQPKGFTRPYKTRYGNGHKITKKRDLWNNERSQMRTFFMNKNGQIAGDDCVTFKHQALHYDVAIFQVTGFISYLHAEVAQGKISTLELVAYEVWMRTKYNGTLWARYNNPIYVAVRKANQDLVAAGKDPVFSVQKEKQVDVFIKPEYTK